MISKNVSDGEIAPSAIAPHSGSSLVPMLVGGLVMIVIGMIVALAFV